MVSMFQVSHCGDTDLEKKQKTTAAPQFPNLNMITPSETDVSAFSYLTIVCF